MGLNFSSDVDSFFPCWFLLSHLLRTCFAPLCFAPLSFAPLWMSKVVNVDVVSDVMWPWCWIGKKNLEAAIDELPDDQFTVNIRWHPFFLGGTSSLAQYPNGKPKNSVGSGNVSARLKAAGSNVGIDFTGLTDRYPNSVLAHSLLSYVLDKDGALIQNKLSEVVFRHYFTRENTQTKHICLKLHSRLVWRIQQQHSRVRLTCPAKLV